MLSSAELYEKVEKLRSELGVTAAQFNRLAGISHGTLRSWRLRGTYPTVDVLDGIAFALGIPLAELLYDIDFKNLSSDQIELLSYWKQINEEQKKAIITTMKSMCNN